MARDELAEQALIEISRAQREPKWRMDAHDQWVQREMIRVRDGKGWIELQAKDEVK